MCLSVWCSFKFKSSGSSLGLISVSCWVCVSCWWMVIWVLTCGVILLLYYYILYIIISYTIIHTYTIIIYYYILLYYTIIHYIISSPLPFLFSSSIPFLPSDPFCLSSSFPLPILIQQFDPACFIGVDGSGVWCVMVSGWFVF